MKLDPIGSNMTEVTVHVHGFRGETKVLFSYKTPVAAMNLSPEWHEEHGSACIKTDCRWSRTTSKHISKWLDGAKANERPQSYFDNLTAQS